jgi:hypothetical protein
LGPLLFLIYVNDISNSCKYNILSFADDTTLYLSHKDLNKLYAEANIGINLLFEWFCANKLALNAQKTKYIVIRPHQKTCNLEDRDIFINDSKLMRIGHNCNETTVKFLGIKIDENLSWKNHVAFVNSKIARALFAIRQCKNFLSHDSLRTLYHALIHPHLLYGILVWGNAGQTNLKKYLSSSKTSNTNNQQGQI